MANPQKSMGLRDKLIEVIVRQEVPIDAIFAAILACKHALMTEAGFGGPADEFRMRVKAIFMGDVAEPDEARQAAVDFFLKIEPLVNDPAYALDERLNALDAVMWKIMNDIAKPGSREKMMKAFEAELRLCARTCTLPTRLVATTSYRIPERSTDGIIEGPSPRPTITCRCT